MKVTLESELITATVEVPHSDVCFDEVMELVKQACLGFGFHPKTVDEWFEEEA